MSKKSEISDERLARRKLEAAKRAELTYAEAVERLMRGETRECERRVIAAIELAANGISRADLNKLMGYSRSYTEGICARLKSAGLVGNSRQGRNSRWCRVDDEARVADVVRAEMLAKASGNKDKLRNVMVHERRRQRALSGTKRAAPAEQADGREDPQEGQFRHILVACSQAAPLKLSGLRRSVFEAIP